MPAPYNLTNMTAATDLLGFTKAVNQFTEGTFTLLMLLAIWIIIFVALKNYYTKNAVFAASTITALIAMLFFIGGLIGSELLIACGVIWALSMLWMYSGGE